jgi:GntR family transcriptional regulator
VNTLEITQEELVQTGSLYGVLGQHNIIIEVGEETIEAVAAQEEAATLLHVPLASPLLLTTRFSWDRDGRFVEYVVAFYHPDLYRYTIGLKRLR